MSIAIYLYSSSCVTAIVSVRSPTMESRENDLPFTRSETTADKIPLRFTSRIGLIVSTRTSTGIRRL